MQKKRDTSFIYSHSLIVNSLSIFKQNLAKNIEIILNFMARP